MAEQRSHAMKARLKSALAALPLEVKLPLRHDCQHEPQLPLGVARCDKSMNTLIQFADSTHRVQQRLNGFRNSENVVTLLSCS